MPVARRRLPALAVLAALATALICASNALAGPTVTVRVEGESATLLPATTVTLGAPDPLNNCPANSVAAAINLATGGNWDHKSFTETILGETHSFAHSDTWAEWVNYKWGGGICNDLLSEGDEVLMLADLEPPPTYAASVLPLVISEAPSVVQGGSPFSVKVSIVHLPAGEVPPGSGTLEPAEGVTVSLGTVHATTGPGGVANITPAGIGSQTLLATKAGDAPSRALSVCIHNGNDGTCGTQTPTGGVSQTATPTATIAPSTAYMGPFAVVARTTGVLDGHVYSRTNAPRVLAGIVTAQNGVSSVSIELWREYRGRCWAYDGRTERFLRAPCAHGRFFKIPSASKFFKVSETRTFSYLMPFALTRGEYVLDITASDTAGNRTTLARGTSRIRFYVR
jgi:hypothetical protein